MTSFFTNAQRHNTVSSHLLIRDERGVSMTEGVIVIPFFIIIWMGLILFHRVYIGRLEAQVEAHNVAFSGAMEGTCNGKKESNDNANTNDLKDEMSQKTANDQQIDISHQAEQSTHGDDGGNSLFDWSHFVTTTSIVVGNIPKPFGGPERTVEGKAKVMCNMKPQNGLSDAIYDMLKGNF
jgi:hypothetical protein